jgi:hypothetical protein
MKGISVLVAALLIETCLNGRTFAEQRASLRIPLGSNAYALHLGDDALFFCVGNRSWRVDLDAKSPTPITADAQCPKDHEGDAACRGTGLDVDIRTPDPKSDDIVDIASGSIALRGHVLDCASAGSALAVATGSQVLVIDAVTRKVLVSSAQGADYVALGPNWIAWIRDGELYAHRR